jgi:hypothetical protein
MPNGGDAFFIRRISAIDSQALADAIDRTLVKRWSEMGATPAGLSSDAEFVRRVSLDVAGRIPLSSEARAFLDDMDPDKREKYVESLLRGPAYANHMSNLWRELLIPEAAGSPQIQFFTLDFDAWLRSRFAKNVPYDRMVREVLTVPVTSGRVIFNPQQQGAATDPSPFAYLAAKDGKPENLAAASSRLFLGIRIECAQCHNHPFATWKREEFWGLASFFAGVERQGMGDAIFQASESKSKRELKIPGTSRVVKATYLDGTTPDWKTVESTRSALADWMTSRDNPYFARATVNRLWSQFFGVGIVEPIDDMGASNLASHPELLDLLADQFVAHEFDLQYLIRSLTRSRAYQLSSEGGSPSHDAYRLFDRMAVRGLTPIQLYDSLTRAAGLKREPPNRFFFNNQASLRTEFVERFAAQDDRPTERQTSILQALTLLNGRLLTDAVSLERGATLPGVADAFFLDTPGKIEALYFAALSRKPRPDELERLVPYVERGGSGLNPKKALGDVFWSILGSAEFVLNH